MNGPTELQEAQSNAQMWKDRHTLAERRLAATVDELTEAQTENARLAALVVEAFDQRDAAQAGREQAEAQRDRAMEQLAESRAAEQATHERCLALLRVTP